jgi:hypothetical protein
VGAASDQERESQEDRTPDAPSIHRHNRNLPRAC